MKRIKIMYISNEATLGGAAQSLIDMLKGIREYAEPFVIIPDRGVIEERLKQLNIDYKIVSFSTGYGPMGTTCEEKVNMDFVSNYQAALELLPIVLDINAQIIHTNSSTSNVGAFLAMMANVPHVWHIRELMEEQFECSFYDAVLKKQLFYSASRVITISHFVQRVVEQKYGLKSIPLYDGLDIERFKEEIDIKKVEKNVFQVIIAGAVTKAKGQWDAIKAFRILLEQGYNNVHLHIVGDGSVQFIWEMKRYIKKYNLDNNIHLHSYRKDLADMRKKSHFAITTSKMEALGRVTLEAMLAGISVIGANSGGTLEIIGEHEERGYLYKQGDSEDLARVIKRAIREYEMIGKGVLENAQHYACDNFNALDYAKKMFTIYQQVIEEYRDCNKEQQDILDAMDTKYNLLKDKYTVASRIDCGQERKAWRMFYNSQKWLQIYHEGKTLEKYFVDNNWKTIAIYGMGHFGCCLYDELEDTSIKVKYAIDQNFECMKEILEIKKPDDELEYVDVVIVTAIHDYDEIKEKLSQKVKCPIVSLEEIIYGA